MEPMNLGSPTSSPGGSPNISYLPPFLLGEINSPSTQRQSIDSLSPTKGRTLAFGMMSPCQASTPEQKSHQNNMGLYHQSLYNKQNMYQSQPPNPSNISFTDKANGPPIEDLYDTLKTHDNSRLFQENNILSPFNQNSFTANTSLNSSQPWNKSSNEEFWVTVFGFTPGSANAVLSRFATNGTVIDKQYPTSGNWAHLRYTTRAERERALALNGRQIIPGVMVGVVICKEPPRVNVASPNTTMMSSQREPVSPRSLCPTPLPNAPVPQRSNGIVSKALEYVLGW